MQRIAKAIIALVVILLIGTGIIAALNSNKETTEISIVATNFPAYDFARAVVGDATNIKMLIKPGQETHDFEPTPEDIIDIQKSKLFIYTGGESDEWVNDILSTIDNTKTKPLKMTNIVKVVEEETVEGMESETEETEYDEHVWTSIKNAIEITKHIKNELIKIAPEKQQIFEENTKNYTDKLANLDSRFQDVVNSGNRKTIVFGDRFPFRYFVDDYGLNYFAAFPGCSEQTEASSKTIAFLIEKIKSEHIPVILKTEASSDNIAKTIANETGTRVLVFNAAHNISIDDFKNGRTYADIMEDNLQVLKEALK